MSRQAVRERLGSLFTTNGSFNAVYAYAPVDLQGFDKVLCIYTDSTKHDLISASLQNSFYTFTLDVFVKRASGETAEDTLDTLHEAIRTVVRANVGDSNWDHLDLMSDSEAFFAEVSGVSYRVERHTLIVKDTEN